MPSGPSERAVELMAEAMFKVSYPDWQSRVPFKQSGVYLSFIDMARAGLVAAHDPALGEDASVRLGDVVAYLRRVAYTAAEHDIVDMLEHRHREGRL